MEARQAQAGNGSLLEVLRHPVLLRANLCVTCAATGIGWIIGNWGGITAMPAFHRKFFPSVGYAGIVGDAYCLFKDGLLSLTGSMTYLTALPAVLLAAPATRQYGRLPTMWCVALSLLASAAVGAAATHQSMLFLCRALGGIAMGLAFQAPTIYLAEVTPAASRGAALFVYNTGIILGALLAQVANMFLAQADWGWRLSIGLQGCPALLMLLLLPTLLESPQSLLQRGLQDQAIKSLETIRGQPRSALVDEVKMLQAAAQAACQGASGTFQRMRLLLSSTRYLPEMVASCLYPAVLMYSGMNVLGTWTPNLMMAFGATPDFALQAATYQFVVALVATIPAIFLIDRLGRRVLLLWGCLTIIACMTTLAALLAVYLPPGSPPATDTMPAGMLTLVTVLLCIHRAALSATLHPLAVTVPAEVQPLQIRADASSITTFVRNGSSFVIVQWTLPLLCATKYGLFIMFSGFTAVGGLLIWLLVPETKLLGLELIEQAWCDHWFWGRFAFVQARVARKHAAAAKDNDDGSIQDGTVTGKERAV